MSKLSNDGQEFVRNHRVTYTEFNKRKIYHITCLDTEHHDISDEDLKNEELFMCVCGESIRNTDFSKLDIQLEDGSYS